MQDLKSLKRELQYIIQSDEQIGQRNLIKAAQTHLKKCHATGLLAEAKKQGRSEEERALCGHSLKQPADSMNCPFNYL
ncbi:MAG: hypothetical protein JNM88_11235 [Chitinophagaceae bacterium]|nr:hypothetical protein [Chitinophagaceae bacterium]